MSRNHKTKVTSKVNEISTKNSIRRAHPSPLWTLFFCARTLFLKYSKEGRMSHKQEQSRERVRGVRGAYIPQANQVEGRQGVLYQHRTSGAERRSRWEKSPQ